METFFRYYVVVKANDIATLAKPVAMNVRFECIGLFEDHNSWCVGYPVDTKNRFLLSKNYIGESWIGVDVI